MVDSVCLRSACLRCSGSWSGSWNGVLHIISKDEPRHAVEEPFLLMMLFCPITTENFRVEKLVNQKIRNFTFWLGCLYWEKKVWSYKSLPIVASHFWFTWTYDPYPCLNIGLNLCPFRLSWLHGAPCGVRWRRGGAGGGAGKEGE